MNSAAPILSVSFCQRDSVHANVSLAGRLDASTLPEAWTVVVEPAARQGVTHVTVDVSRLSYCDGAGLGLFAELRRIVAANQGTLQFAGLSAEHKRFVEMSMREDMPASSARPKESAQRGQSKWTIGRDMRELIAFTRELLTTLLWALMHPWKSKAPANTESAHSVIKSTENLEP